MTGRSGTAAAFFEQLFERLARPFADQFDFTRSQVPYPAANAEAPCDPLYRVAKPHSLYSPFEDRVQARGL
jgi:hypothetical protein